jgi:hypothetical protein
MGERSLAETIAEIFSHQLRTFDRSTSGAGNESLDEFGVLQLCCFVPQLPSLCELNLICYFHFAFRTRGEETSL